MDSEFELIRYKDNLPARIEEKQGNINIPIHWHKEIELIYVLEGNLSINVNGTFRSLASDSFLLINSAENHSLTAESAKCLILDISYEFAQQFDSGLYHSVFEVVAGSGAEEEIHNYLWQLSKTVNENELPVLRQFSLITEVGTKTELGKYSSKYALTELLICGECGTPYRRCTWTACGNKRIVWRCISRLDYGKKRCHNSPTMSEEDLHRAIMSAVQTVAMQNTKLLQTLKTFITMTVKCDDSEDRELEIKVRLAEINDEFQKVMSLVSVDDDNNLVILLIGQMPESTPIFAMLVE